MSSDIYGQLARMPLAFKILKKNVVINPATQIQVLDPNNMRVYVGFSFTVGTGTINVTPADNFINDNGYIFPVTANTLEFFLERHLGEVGQSWFIKNATAAGVTITIIEVIYNDPSN